MASDLGIKTILRAIVDAAQRWADADFPPRVRVTEQIVARTGYSIPVVEYALDRLFFDITTDTLQATIVSELGSVHALDGFVTQAGRPDRFAHAVGRVCIISSRTTIGVALLPAIFALCAGCEVTVKDREDAFVNAFFETVYEEDDRFRSRALAKAWRGGDDAVDLRSFDCVVAFGKNQTIEQIRAACSAESRFIAFGNRASAGYITAQALGTDSALQSIADGAARDLILYDSQGCLSLHVLFVEAANERDVRGFLSRLASAAERATVEFPLGADDAARTARVSSIRNTAAFRAAGGRGTVLCDDACSFVLVYDPPADEPPVFAPRVLGVIPVSTPLDAVAYLRKHGVTIEAFALSERRTDLVEAAISAGAVRLAPFGELQRLPVSGDHGGRPRIADFIRWIDREI